MLVAGSRVTERDRVRERAREREKQGEGRGETGIVCGAGKRHVISQTDKIQSSAKAKSRGYSFYMRPIQTAPAF